MKSVVLRLEGPLQAWGTQGRFGHRDTDREPSKSGVLGLVGAALGMTRDDDATLAQLASLQMAVRIEREGSLLRDYHTVGGGTFAGRPHTVWPGKNTTAQTYRHYLTDASFLVALGSTDRPLVERVATALKDPRWPLCLGRRACVPSVPVYAGVADATPEHVVRTWPAAAQADVAAAFERFRIVLEASPTDGRPRDDLPLSFALYARRHGRRYVRFDHVSRSELSGDSA